jgi:alanine dehydrogenase
MTLILGRKDVEQLLTMEMTLEAVEAAFREHGQGTTLVPDRIGMYLDQYHGVIGVMPGYMEGMQAAGVKVICHHEDNPKKHHLPASAGLVVYHDPTTGMPLAILDCGYITQMRTGAATGVSVKYLARADARVLGIVGAGAQARSQVAAVSHVRSLTKVKAFDIDPDATKRLLKEIADLGLEAEAVGSPEEACTGVDILVTCTPARSPFIQGEWIRKGMHVTSVGADMPGKSELHPDVYRRADKWVTDLINQARITGEIGDAMEQGAISEGTLHATLGEIVAGHKPGREKDEEITVFKSTGMAIQDVAAAKRVYELARDKGIGVEVSVTP